MSTDKHYSPLHDWHVENGAKMIDFAGWSMPLNYKAGALEEHHAVRRSAGLFDVSHMGEIVVIGDRRDEFINHLVSSNINDLEENDAGYGLLCKEDGRVLDDLFVYRLKDRYFVVVNAANGAKDLAWFESHAVDFDVEIRDQSSNTCMIALQGPSAIPLLDTCIEGKASKLPRFSSAWLELFGISCMVGRTGYTGEDGVELFCPWDDGAHVWENLLKAALETGIELLPAGLAARDSLRFEAGFALYGHELDEETIPPEARLKWACDFETDFIGSGAIQEALKKGLRKKLATFVLTERGVPRQGYRVYSEDDRDIGSVATGMFAPTVGEYAGNAFVQPEYSKTGTEVKIDIRGTKKSGRVVKRPLYKPAYRS